MEVRRELTLDAPREEVWAALTEAERLEEWFANEVELDARPGGRGVFRWDDGAERVAVVERVEEERQLELTWSDPDGDRTSTVAFTLADAAEGTRLTVVETAAEWSWAIELSARALARA
jgi:uncharacterized protein YndB with AHSA1/START domain